MGCETSKGADPTARPLKSATSSASAGKSAAVQPVSPSPEYVEGKQVARPDRPKFPPARASRGSWNDLMDAAERGQVSKIPGLMRRYPVDAGDNNCWTALMEATERRHVEVVRLLLQGGANPNIYDKNGWTALMAATEHGTLEAARLLIDAGAIVDLQDSKGWTALMEAAEKGNGPMVKLMVDSGAPKADLNVSDKKGWTAFMAACEGGNLDCVEYLWRHGAEHKIRDKNRWTALEEAKLKGFKQIVAFMEPVVAAEKQLQSMLDTDTWSPEDAMRYLDDARKVWCLRELVRRAEERLAECLVSAISGNASDESGRGYSFDLLIQLGHSNMVSNDAALRATGIEICRKRLQNAVGKKNANELKWAMATIARAELYPSSELEDAVDEAAKEYQKIANLPPEWNVKLMISGLFEGRMLSKTKIDDQGLKDRFQSLLDACTKKVYTRDRKGGKVPDALRLVDVIHVQNEQLLAEYNLRQQSVRSSISKGSSVEAYSEGVLSNRPVEGRPELDASINEVWLFHGTKKEAADSITENDFRLDLSGSNAGTLFGSGIYLAEAASKADEYTEPDDDGIRILLLCRATLGRCLYIDTVATNPGDYTRRCLSGEYNAVLGDREKCRGTYREFVVFDDDQVLPEYMLMYRRAYSND